MLHLQDLIPEIMLSHALTHFCISRCCCSFENLHVAALLSSCRSAELPTLPSQFALGLLLNVTPNESLNIDMDSL